MTPTLPSLMLLLPAAIYSQTSESAPQPHAFEVASIKPNNSGSGSSGESTSPGRITDTNITISALIQSAFGVKEFQISGGPGWLNGDKYDIAATTGTSKDLNRKELQPYLQSLLADRFQFKYHRESKEMQVYSLVVAKGGAKLTSHVGESGTSTHVSSGSGKSSLTSSDTSMANFAGILGGRLDRVVIDGTGLKGTFDLKLEWAPNPAPDSDEPSLFTALQDQLGLRLESTKGPVEIIVIDRLEKPSEN